MNPPSRRISLLAPLGVILVSAWAVPPAQAHGGPADPIASSWLARIQSLPGGMQAQVVGGDQRMWLRTAPGLSVVVLDYRAVPYLRFTSSGVEVNQNSAMYYLNLPNAVTPPANLTPVTSPHWVRASTGHTYSWHDGRLHALASVALPPGVADAGTWRIPLLVNGRPSAITGSLFHAAGPSIVWFWPAVVLLLCVLAAWRVDSPALSAWSARGLAAAALLALSLGMTGRELYGRPTVTASQLVVMGLVLAFVAACAAWLATGRLGFAALLVIGLAAVGQAIVFAPTLLNGYVFTTLPRFVARAATVLALGAGPGLLLLSFRLGAAEPGRPPGPEAERAGASEDELAWDLPA